MAVTLNDKYLKGVVNADELKGMEPMVKVAHEMIENKNGLGNDFLGWVDLPVNYDKEEFDVTIFIAARAEWTPERAV